ncbi:hypothetical protein KK062_15890 [Fulvivirgaceae bacterium PWU5]|uniref:Uncharacterized protein n=1 Tax=Dawidia cretensis TaxID=2782350 RepID=A0AAP2GV21_9BACT|nr:hypothetical protein [Dawidia cretensis]MBT1709725.1 hypothetical protein [Dawidia cretensis]
MRLKFLLFVTVAASLFYAYEASCQTEGRYEQAWILELEKEIPLLTWPNWATFVGVASPNDTLLVVNTRLKTESYLVEINSDGGNVQHIVASKGDGRMVSGMKHRTSKGPLVWAETKESHIPGYYDLAEHQVKYYSSLDKDKLGQRAIGSNEVEDESIYRFGQSQTSQGTWELSRWSATGNKKYWTVHVNVLKEWYALYQDIYGPVDFSLQACTDGVWLVINLPNADTEVVLMKFSSQNGKRVYFSKTKGRFTNYSAVHVTQRYKEAWFLSNHERITKFYSSGQQAWGVTLTLPKGIEPYLINTLPTHDGGAICWFTLNEKIYLYKISNMGNVTWKHIHSERQKLFVDASSIHELPSGDLIVASYWGVITKYALK